METSVGTFSVELYTAHAPRTCNNFKELAKMGKCFLLSLGYNSLIDCQCYIRIL